MGDCNCANDGNQSDVIPDFTKHGFAHKAGLVSADGSSAENTVDGLQQKLAAQNVHALDISACVGASYNGRQICFNFPVIGNVCFPAPVSIPVSAALKVCGSICTKFVIPTGLKVTLYVNDNPVWSGTVWGSC